MSAGRRRMLRCPDPLGSVAPLLVLALCLPPAAHCAPVESSRARTDSLMRVALRCDLGRVEGRRAAATALGRALEIEPARADLWGALGRTQLAAGERGHAIESLRMAVTLAPEDATLHRRRGEAMKQEWLATLDPAALDSARIEFARALDLAPGDEDAAIALAAIALGTGQPRVATRLAARVLARNPARGEALLALGCAAYRMGEIVLADSALEAARSRLPSGLARRFNDERWFVDEQEGRVRDTGPALQRYTREYWRSNDPDHTTPENEAHLDFASRLALALLLFRNEQELIWDERCRLFARYGPPGALADEPSGSAATFQYPRRAEVPYAPDPLVFGHASQVWSYPELGMRIDLWQMGSGAAFQAPIDFERDPATPDPARLEARGDLVALAGGRGVFRAMKPGTRPLPVRHLLARFPTAAGARVVAYVAAGGGPGDSLVAALAVVTPAGRVLARETRHMAISACDPASEKVAEFAFDVPAGEYRVDLSVDDAQGGRGLARPAAEVLRASGRPTLSDVVLLCSGTPSPLGATRVRLEPDLARRAQRSHPLSAYFEVNRLVPGRGGESRFEYTYTVRPAGRRGVPGAGGDTRTLRASREESFAGTLRRQYIVVPVASLPPGPYELVVEVRDLVGSGSARGSVAFTLE